MNARSLALRVGAHAGLAIGLTWPVAADLGGSVPGAGRTDLWNSIWSLWFVAESALQGRLPWSTGLLDHPDGGVLVVADPVNATLALPLTIAFGPSVAYALVVLAQLVFAGLAAFALARHLFGHDAAGWVAGPTFMAAPVLISGVHNGTSEAFAGGWLALAVLGLFVASEGRRVVGAGVVLGIATVASWYLGVVAWMFWLALLVFGRRGVARRDSALRLAAVGGLALAIALPAAGLAKAGSIHEDNLVGIKNKRELMSVRRSIGVADPRGWFVPGDFRSPDFRKLSRYGEEFIHCHYLGWTLLLGSAGALLLRREREDKRVLIAAGLTAGVLAMGPVVAMDGAPLILEGRRGVPLPYFLIEGAPGFDGLSLLYRFAAGPALVVAVLAGGLAARFPRAAPLLALVALAELRFASPVAGLPHHESVLTSEPLDWLAEAPEGAVMNFPVVGGRSYLFEQTVHGKPIAGSLNFPNNRASMKVWAAALDSLERDDSEAEFAEHVGAVARRQGIRYVVVHLDPMARPDMHDEAVRALRAAVPAASEAPSIRVHQLW